MVRFGSQSGFGRTIEASWHRRRTFCSHDSNGYKQYSHALNEIESMRIPLIFLSPKTTTYSIFIKFIPFELRENKWLFLKNQFSGLIDFFRYDLSTLKEFYLSFKTKPIIFIENKILPSIDHRQQQNYFHCSSSRNRSISIIVFIILTWKWGNVKWLKSKIDFFIWIKSFCFDNYNTEKKNNNENIFRHDKGVWVQQLFQEFDKYPYLADNSKSIQIKKKQFLILVKTRTCNSLIFCDSDPFKIRDFCRLKICQCAFLRIEFVNLRDHSTTNIQKEFEIFLLISK